ncbi:MAG: plasmid stabilization protein [Proteobacteria bacterium]|nr:plasmid stabilization protein [Pseudomonadota bacterium]
MANLSIRNLDDGVHKLLCMAADLHGVSMEEEVRRIIVGHFKSSENIAEGFMRCFGKKNGIDLKLRKRKSHQPMAFS